MNIKHSEESVEQLGYFLAPSQLFSSLAKRAAEEPPQFILDDLTQVLSSIERSTMGKESEEDLDLTSSKLGRTEKDKNKPNAKILVHLEAIEQVETFKKRLLHKIFV